MKKNTDVFKLYNYNMCLKLFLYFKFNSILTLNVRLYN